MIQVFNGTTFLGGIAFAGFASTNPSFLGVSTVGGFNRVVISDSFSGTPNPFQSLDNLTVSAAAAAVPEPAAIGLLLTGLLIVGGVSAATPFDRP